MQNNNISLIGFIFNLFDLQYVSSTINITILLHTSISITIYNGKYKYNTIHYYVWISDIMCTLSYTHIYNNFL